MFAPVTESRSGKTHAFRENFSENFGFIHHNSGESDTTGRVSSKSFVDASTEVGKSFDVVVFKDSSDTFASELFVEFLLKFLVCCRSRNDLEQDSAVHRGRVSVDSPQEKLSCEQESAETHQEEFEVVSEPAIS